MNRRDFFKVLGLGVAGLVAPKWTTERNETMIGDILAKLGRNETLTSDEQSRIRIWGNNTEFNNAYVLGLQNGRSDIVAKSVYYDGMPITTLFSKVLERDTYSIDIQIPSYAKHIQIICMGRITGAAGGTVHVRCNDDSGSNYEYVYVQGDSTTVSTNGTTTDRAFVGIVANSGDAAGYFDGFHSTILHVRSNKYKTFISHMAWGDSNFLTSNMSARWRSTEIVNKISIICYQTVPTQQSYFLAGSVISVYAIA